MAEILGLGISHWPRLAQAEAGFSARLRQILNRSDIPREVRDPSNWPAAMRSEWGVDEGVASAANHRDAILEGLRKVRQRLDEFRPDAVLIWGDDQYENFREDIIPPFCVLAYDDPVRCKPYARLSNNVWGKGRDEEVELRVATSLAKELASGLLEQEFDVSYAYRSLHYEGLSHAFMNAVLYLDYEDEGFPYPIIPLQVNCYGRHVISNRGSVPLIESAASYDPPSPSPKRCFDLGRACARVLRASNKRVAVLASSSWSHAFLCNKNWQLFPDVAADRSLYDALLAGDFKAWRDLSLEEMESAGQQEVLNWVCLAGAMSELGSRVEWSQFVETHIFNSTKVAAIFEAV